MLQNQPLQATSCKDLKDIDQQRAWMSLNYNAILLMHSHRSTALHLRDHWMTLFPYIMTLLKVSMIPLHQFRHRLQSLWYDDNLRQAKRDKRRLKRKFRKSSLRVDKKQFELKFSEYTSLLETSKRNFF